MLRATTVCIFQHLNFQECKEKWCALYALVSTCASRCNGVNYSSLRPRDGSTPAAVASLLFEPPEPQNIGKKHGASQIFLPSREPAPFFFWLFLLPDLLSFSSLALPAAAFPSVHLSDVWLLNFLRVGLCKGLCKGMCPQNMVLYDRVAPVSVPAKVFDINLLTNPYHGIGDLKPFLHIYIYIYLHHITWPLHIWLA